MDKRNTEKKKTRTVRSREQRFRDLERKVAAERARLALEGLTAAAKDGRVPEEDVKEYRRLLRYLWVTAIATGCELLGAQAVDDYESAFAFVDKSDGVAIISAPNYAMANLGRRVIALGPDASREEKMAVYSDWARSSPLEVVTRFESRNSPEPKRFR